MTEYKTVVDCVTTDAQPKDLFFLIELGSTTVTETNYTFATYLAKGEVDHRKTKFLQTLNGSMYVFSGILYTSQEDTNDAYINIFNVDLD